MTYQEIKEYTDKHGDQWEPCMGEDALDFFCSDCAEFLSLDRIGLNCLSCEEKEEKEEE